MIVIMVFLFGSACRSGASVNYAKKSVAGVSLFIIEMDLQSEKIIPVSAAGRERDGVLHREILQKENKKL